jgi:hypothetical protein
VPEVLVIEAAEIAGSQGREERGHRGGGKGFPGL